MGRGGVPGVCSTKEGSINIGVPLEMDGEGVDVGSLGSPVLGFHIGIHGVPSIGVPLEIDELGLDVGVLRVPNIGVPCWDSWGPQYWGSSGDGWAGVGCGGPCGPQYWGSS